MARLRFDHIHMFAQDPEATAQWYCRHFAAAIVGRSAHHVDVAFDGGPRLNISYYRGGASEAAGGLIGQSEGLDHIGFTIAGADPAQVDQAVDGFAAGGAEVAVAPATYSSGNRVAFLRDPAGGLIELALGG